MGGQPDWWKMVDHAGGQRCRLAEWSNSGAGSGLLWKIETGEKREARLWMKKKNGKWRGGWQKKRGTGWRKSERRGKMR